MPGFTKKTGGLVIEEEWRELPAWKEEGPVLVFTYERDWELLARALFEYCKGESCHQLLVAQGRGKESFMAAAKACGAGDFVEELSYLNQTEWDKIMKGCSALVIRGEESMSRACLSGIPFIWHAYPQSGEYQLVKVRALLERMKVHFNKDDFEIVEKVWIEINSPDGTVSSLRAERSNPYAEFFAAIPRLVPAFQDFARSLRKNGDLASNLMTYIEKLAII